VGANLTTVEIYNQYRQVVENVTYYTNSYGEAVYDDDIIWGSEELLLSWRVTGDGNVPSRNKKRYYAVKPADGWPSFPIPYRYDSASTRTTLQPYVDAALAKWKSLLPCLSFEERDPDPTFVQVRVPIPQLPRNSTHLPNSIRASSSSPLRKPMAAKVTRLLRTSGS
jgi:hypothetical protein